MIKVVYVFLFCFFSGFVFSQTEKKEYVSQMNEAFTETLAIDSLQLIDVRTESEYELGYIPGAKNIDVKACDFEKKILKLNKKFKVAVYCHSGSRSKLAADIFVKLGFSVFELDEGIMNWDGDIVVED